MKKPQTLIIVIVVLAVIIIGIVLFLVLKPSPIKRCGDNICGPKESPKNCLQDCPQPTNRCGDGECDAKEQLNPALCPVDCAQIETHTECQNQLCVTVDGAGADECTSNSECAIAQLTHKVCQNQQCTTVEGAGTNQCTTNAECASTTESRFGVGWGRLDLKSEISELGEIYLTILIGPEVFGWRIVKGNQKDIILCKSCCIEPNCTSECEAGYIYYCEPENREVGIFGIDVADEFYRDDFNILFSVSPGSYGLKPKNVQDLLSLDYPVNVQVYKDYIKYLLQQYPNVKYWQVLGEADNPRMWGDTPENYARFFTLTSSEIKNYCPNCKVGISLVGPNPSDRWFNAITSICNTIDFLDLHQYHSETMDELKEFEDTDLTKWKTSCPGVEIISIETGIPSEPFTQKGTVWELGTSETKQAQDLIKYLTMMFNAGYNKIYYYLFDHDYVPGIPDMFEHVGLLNKDNSKKISFTSYKTMIEKVDYFTSITKLSDGQYKYAFSNKDPVYVLWCDSGSCSLPSEITRTVKLTDYLGNEEIKDASRVTLGESPVFVEEK